MRAKPSDTGSARMAGATPPRGTQPRKPFDGRTLSAVNDRGAPLPLCPGAMTKGALPRPFRPTTSSRIGGIPACSGTVMGTGNHSVNHAGRRRAGRVCSVARIETKQPRAANAETRVIDTHEHETHRAARRAEVRAVPAGGITSLGGFRQQTAPVLSSRVCSESIPAGDTPKGAGCLA